MTLLNFSMVRIVLAKLIALMLFWGILSAVAAAQDCAPPKLSVNSKGYNIFSSDQEMVLGDLTYQRMSGDMHFVKDPQLVAYINAIGEKLIEHLPPTGLTFHFFIVDIPEANAFDVPGGYIFLSRKLIGFADTEGELAGVMAHELGHAVVRHGASQFSEMLKKVLNVTAVGDRKDIADKYNLLIERRRTKDISGRSGEESEHQLEADRIGLFAMISSGYDPNEFAGFFDRLVETKGKTGNWFTDIFDKTQPEEKRLREMIKISEQLPAQCREKLRAGASQEFLKWQADVVSYHDTNQKEELPALLWKKELSPKLRSDISHFAFSLDGRYFLAQDDFAITIIQREPLEVVFQIPAPEAHEASFTPDGKFVVFGTKNLRYEKWSVAEKKPVHIRELVVRRDCWEHRFSPDGNYLVCFDYDLNLNIHDTQTGKRVFEKKDFYRLTFWEFEKWIDNDARDDSQRKRLFNIEFSPDSHFLVVARNDTLLSLDLSTMKPVKTGGDLREVTRRPFLFLEPNKILGMSGTKVEDSGFFSFPEGKQLAKFSFGAEELIKTANPNYIIIKPLTNAKMGLYDLARGAVVSGSNKLDAAVWDNLIVYESDTGKVLLSEIRTDEAKKVLITKPVGTIDIPVASIGQPYTADLSANLQWLAVSTKTRGALWSLSSGERKFFVRGFRGVVAGNDGSGIGEFPKQDHINHALAVFNPLTSDAKAFREISETGAKQYGAFLLVRRGLKEPRKSEDDKADKKTDADDSSSEAPLKKEVRFELRSVIDDKLIWSREFPKEAPRFFFDAFSGRLILYWTLGSDVGKARLKDEAALAARAKALGNKDDDYLVEVVDAYRGNPVGTLLLETGKGSFSIDDGFSEGDWLVLRDSENRVLAYSIKDGDLRHRFFGSYAAINPAKTKS